MRQVTFKDRQADRSAARLPLGDISAPFSSMSTVNCTEELDFRLIFEEDGRQTAGTCHFLDVS